MNPSSELGMPEICSLELHGLLQLMRPLQNGPWLAGYEGRADVWPPR